MLKKLFYISTFLILANTVLGQHGISFYHLRDATFQNTAFNPALFPQGKIFIGLPGISGINYFLSSPLSYNDIFTDNEAGTKDINIDNAVSELVSRNLISNHLRVNLLHVGFRVKSGAAFSIFANARSETDVVFPKQVVEWGWYGNGTILGEDVNIGALGITSNTFYEIGIGASHSALDGKLRYGARLKMYQGLFNVSTPSFFKGSFRTEPENFQLQAELENGVLRTAGVEVLSGNEGDLASYLISNPNKGLGLDIGIDYRINQYYGFSFSVSDFGFISWSEGIKNFDVSDTTLRYVGIELRGADDVAQALEDSLLNKFDFDETSTKYTTMMPSTVLASWTWYTPYAGIDVISSVGAKLIQAQPKMMYGIGLRKAFGPKLILSATANKLPQQFFNIGAALSATAGVFQFYLASDRTINYSVPSMQWAEVRVGMNIVIGSGRRRQVDKGPAGYSYGAVKDLSGTVSKQKGVTTNSFMGQPVKAKKQEGIYTIIPKQNKPEASTITPDIDWTGKRKGPPASASGDILNFWRNFFGKKQPRVYSDSGRNNRQFGSKKKPQSATGKVNHGKKKRSKPKQRGGGTMKKRIG